MGAANQSGGLLLTRAGGLAGGLAGWRAGGLAGGRAAPPPPPPPSRLSRTRSPTPHLSTSCRSRSVSSCAAAAGSVNRRPRHAKGGGATATFPSCCASHRNPPPSPFALWACTTNDEGHGKQGGRTARTRLPAPTARRPRRRRSRPRFQTRRRRRRRRRPRRPYPSPRRRRRPRPLVAAAGAPSPPQPVPARDGPDPDARRHPRLPSLWSCRESRPERSDEKHWARNNAAAAHHKAATRRPLRPRRATSYLVRPPRSRGGGRRPLPRESRSDGFTGTELMDGFESIMRVRRVPQEDPVHKGRKNLWTRNAYR